MKDILDRLHELYHRIGQDLEMTYADQKTVLDAHNEIKQLRQGDGIAKTDL